MQLIIFRSDPRYAGREPITAAVLECLRRRVLTAPLPGGVTCAFTSTGI